MLNIIIDSVLKSHYFKFSAVNPYNLSIEDKFMTHDKVESFLMRENNLLDLGAWNDMLKPDYVKNESVSKFLEDLIGTSGMRGPNLNEVSKYLSFLNSNSFKVNYLQLYYLMFKKKILLTDLGTIVDVSIVNSIFKKTDAISIMEIGGGYGRLAFGLIKNRKISNYTLVDPIPSSLALAADYFKKNDLTFKFITNSNDKLEQISLLNPSHLKVIPNNSIDLVVNLESFQEMTQDWVDEYVNIINMKTRSNSIFYHSNALGYKNKFNLNLGANWKLLTSYNHPRHWTDTHRTEVYLRG